MTIKIKKEELSMRKVPKATVFLHEIPPGSKIKADCFNSKNKKIGSMITFHHTDGMYSYCTVDNKKKDVIHLHVLTPLKRGKKYYQIGKI